MKSWILGAILLVAVGVGGGVLLLSQNLDEIVRSAIESQGSAALGTAVRVGSVELELAEGRGRIRDLQIANPPGSGEGNLLELGVVTLAIDATSALAVARGNSRHFIIERVSLEEPRAALVVGADGSTNLQALQDAMADGSSKASSSSGQTEPLLLTLKSVSMERAAVRVDTSEIDGKQRDLALPDFSATSSSDTPTARNSPRESHLR